MSAPRPPRLLATLVGCSLLLALAPGRARPPHRTELSVPRTQVERIQHEVHTEGVAQRKAAIDRHRARMDELARRATPRVCAVLWYDYQNNVRSRPVTFVAPGERPGGAEEKAPATAVYVPAAPHEVLVDQRVGEMICLLRRQGKRRFGAG